MFRQIIIFCVFSGLLLVSLSSCNSYEKLLKSDDVNHKLTKANEYFDKKSYYKASNLYESLLQVMKGTKNFEPIYFRYAYSIYYLKDYPSASYHFKNFVDYFPASRDAEEAMYMHVICLYKMSNKVSLDQTSTIKALEAMQSFINVYPESKRLNEANEYMIALRNKLEEKSVSAAKLYFNIGHYKAASVAYKAVMEAYPDSPSLDMYQYMIIRSLYQYAKSSVPSKQEERYANVISEYEILKTGYPQSKYLSEASKYSLQATNQVNKLRNEYQ